jgi:hypothetical protein
MREQKNKMVSRKAKKRSSKKRHFRKKQIQLVGSFLDSIKKYGKEKNTSISSYSCKKTLETRIKIKPAYQEKKFRLKWQRKKKIEKEKVNRNCREKRNKKSLIYPQKIKKKLKKKNRIRKRFILCIMKRFFKSPQYKELKSS